MLEKLETERKRLIYELDVIDEQIEQIRVNKIREQYGVYVGCYVVHNDSIFLVTKIGNYFTDKQKGWVFGTRYKKDSSMSKITRCLYSEWDVDDGHS